MKLVVQRVSHAKVSKIGEKTEVIAEIGMGAVVFLGIGKDDTTRDVQYLTEKLFHLRMFDDKNSKMNLSLAEVGGAVLIIPEFTLYGDCRSGRRPDFALAAPPEYAKELFLAFVDTMKKTGLKVAAGEFRAYMSVEICNDGPVTFVIDSRER